MDGSRLRGNAVIVRLMGRVGLAMRSGRRLARHLAALPGTDGNPLRRRCDRVEHAARLALLVIFLAGGPLLASVTGRWTQAAAQHQVREQQSWHRIRAVLTEPAPRPYDAYGGITTYWVPARWHAPSGATRIGEVPTSAGLPAGSPVMVWVNGAGQVTGRQPLPARLVALREVVAELLTVAGIGLVLLLAAGLIHWQLNRRRLAGWAAEWACFGPHWTTLR